MPRINVERIGKVKRDKHVSFEEDKAKVLEEIAHAMDFSVSEVIRLMVDDRIADYTKKAKKLYEEKGGLLNGTKVESAG